MRLTMGLIFLMISSVVFAEPFHDAAKKGDIKAVTDLIKNKHVFINLRDEKGNTALHYAVYNCDLKMIKLLLDNYADVNAKNYEYEYIFYTSILNENISEERKISTMSMLINTGKIDKDDLFFVLQHAIPKGYVKIVKFLLSKGANDEEMFDGDSPFVIAIRENQVGVLEELISYYKVNIQEDNSLLCYSLENNQTDIAKYLIEKGTPVNKRDGRGTINYETPFYWAVFRDHYEIGMMLLERGASIGFELYQPHTRTLLMLAARRKDCRFLKFLIAKGADINATDERSSTALRYATQYLNFEGVKILVENGAKLNAIDESEATPFSTPLYMNNFEIIEYLLKKGINPDLCGKSKWTPLMSAADYDRVNIVKLLIQYKADVNAQDINGDTPLMEACVSPEITLLLLENGANVNLKNKKGETALDLAKQYKDNEKTIELLKKYSKSKP